MKIAYVLTRGDSVGGASIHVRDLAGAMQSRGHSVAVVLGQPGSFAGQLAGRGVPVRVAPALGRSLHPLRDLAALREIGSILRELAPDLVSTHTAKAGWLGRAAARQLGIPAIHTPHGLPVGDRLGSAAGLVFTAAERLAARWCRAIVCVCEAERRLALRRRIAPPSRLHVIPNGVQDTDPRLLARPESTPVRIASVARFAPPKDHRALLLSLAALKDLPWELDLVGDGPGEPAVRRLAEELGIATRVRFHGYLEDPAPVLARAGVFVLASRSEAFPRSILEAMRAGLPVVASDVGGVAEAVRDGCNGRLVSPDRQDFSVPLRCMLFNAAERQLMGERSRQIYESRYRLEPLIEATESLYGTVVSIGNV